MGKWIPCSVRLPEKTGDYLVTALMPMSLCEDPVYPAIDIASYYTHDGVEEYGFKETKGWKTGFKVTAWMPLPEPYQEENK